VDSKKIDPYSAPLDKEEKDLLDSYDKGEWEAVDNLKEEMSIAKEAAYNYLHKSNRVNIRISSSDLKNIKQRAAYEGLPYQTLMASVLHKYAAGHL
jgi:predicted DNA binding CopG/RHH family protein